MSIWLAAAYDPLSTSSKIAIAMVLDNNTFEFGAWDGSSWVDPAGRHRCAQ